MALPRAEVLFGDSPEAPTLSKAEVSQRFDDLMTAVDTAPSRVPRPAGRRAGVRRGPRHLLRRSVPLPPRSPHEGPRRPRRRQGPVPRGAGVGHRRTRRAAGPAARPRQGHLHLLAAVHGPGRLRPGGPGEDAHAAAHAAAQPHPAEEGHRPVPPLQGHLRVHRHRHRRRRQHPPRHPGHDPDELRPVGASNALYYARGPKISYAGYDKTVAYSQFSVSDSGHLVRTVRRPGLPGHPAAVPHQPHLLQHAAGGAHAADGPRHVRQRIPRHPRGPDRPGRHRPRPPQAKPASRVRPPASTSRSPRTPATSASPH
jgi:hypothetical protein